MPTMGEFRLAERNLGNNSGAASGLDKQKLIELILSGLMGASSERDQPGQLVDIGRGFKAAVPGQKADRLGGASRGILAQAIGQRQQDRQQESALAKEVRQFDRQKELAGIDFENASKIQNMRGGQALAKELAKTQTSFFNRGLNPKIPKMSDQDKFLRTNAANEEETTALFDVAMDIASRGAQPGQEQNVGPAQLNDFERAAILTQFRELKAKGLPYEDIVLAMKRSSRGVKTNFPERVKPEPVPEVKTDTLDQLKPFFKSQNPMLDQLKPFFKNGSSIPQTKEDFKRLFR